MLGRFDLYVLLSRRKLTLEQMLRNPTKQSFKRINQFVLPILAGFLVPIVVPWILALGVGGIVMSLGKEAKITCMSF